MKHIERQAVVRQYVTTKITCDRCGAEAGVFYPNPMAFAEIHYQRAEYDYVDETSTVTIDLCPACIKNVVDFMKVGWGSRLTLPNRSGGFGRSGLGVHDKPPEPAPAVDQLCRVP